jgi:hypothetical protein
MGPLTLSMQGTTVDYSISKVLDLGSIVTVAVLNVQALIKSSSVSG